MHGNWNLASPRIRPTQARTGRSNRIVHAVFAAMLLALSHSAWSESESWQLPADALVSTQTVLQS